MLGSGKSSAVCFRKRCLQLSCSLQTEASYLYDLEKEDFLGLDESLASLACLKLADSLNEVANEPGDLFFSCLVFFFFLKTYF